MKRSSALAVILLILFALSLLNTGVADASDSNPYAGDLFTRSTLTGDWFTARDTLAQNGITFDCSLTQIAQTIASGGKDNDSEYGGRGNLTINADTQKMGMWPGGFFMMEVEGNFEDAVNANTGALMPINNNHLYPLPGGNNLNIPASDSFSQW